MPKWLKRSLRLPNTVRGLGREEGLYAILSLAHENLIRYSTEVVLSRRSPSQITTLLQRISEIMNYKRRISASISALALFFSLVIPISNQAFVESSPPRQKLSHLSNPRVNRSNLVNRSDAVNSI